MTIEILRRPTSRARLSALAEGQFGDMVKAVVDVERGVMAIGGELHSESVEDEQRRRLIREIVGALVAAEPPG